MEHLMEPFYAILTDADHASPKASLLTALAPPGLNFTRVWISDAKAWHVTGAAGGENWRNGSIDQ